MDTASMERLTSSLTLPMLGVGVWWLSVLEGFPEILTLIPLALGAIGGLLSYLCLRLRLPMGRRVLVDLCGCALPVFIALPPAIAVARPLYLVIGLAGYAASYALCTYLKPSAVVLRYLEPSAASTLLLAYALPRTELPLLVLCAALATAIYADVVSYLTHYRKVIPPTRRFVIGGARGLDAIVLSSLTTCSLCIAIYILDPILGVG